MWTPITAPPVLRPTVISYKNSLISIGGVNGGIPQSTIYQFVDATSDNHWVKVGSMSVGRYRHAVVPLGNCGTALLVAGGYVRGNSVEDEGNEKSNSVELVLL